jgi:hypothetical protein
VSEKFPTMIYLISVFLPAAKLSSRLRYIFEKGMPPDEGWLGDAIVECARKVILDKHPDWENARQISLLPETSFRPTFPIH